MIPRKEKSFGFLGVSFSFQNKLTETKNIR